MGKAKLTPEQVAEIRRQYAAGRRPGRIAKQFKVTYHCIWLIANGWTHKGSSTHNLKESETKEWQAPQGTKTLSKNSAKSLANGL